MLSNYPAVFLKDDANDGYVVNFPDFASLTTEGDTLDEAIAMAIDALALRVFYADIDGYDLPKPSDIKAVNVEAVQAECEMQGCEAFVNIVSVNAEEYAKAHLVKYVRKNVTIPDWLEQRAKEKHINFSLALQQSLASQLGVPLK
ncbi:MAG: type II toxin-antitoxin system HicB family antitoxin [Clostridium sp.]|jgi:predicted RNase H-like HicB family nuclease|nr:type II toxin-antitoxin system HicB family antitoxin [Clostridium sp.]